MKSKALKYYQGAISRHICPRLPEPKKAMDAYMEVIKLLKKDGGIPDTQLTLDGRMVVTCEQFPTFKATFNTTDESVKQAKIIHAAKERNKRGR